MTHHVPPLPQPLPAAFLHRRHREGTTIDACQYHYFSLIEWLRQMFKCPSFVAALDEYGGQRMASLAAGNSSDAPEVLADIWDGDVVRTLRDLYPDFFANPRNLLLNVTADGFLAFGKTTGKASTRSGQQQEPKGKSLTPITVWCVNLPPSIRSKLGASAQVGFTPLAHYKDIQPFLEPLCDELLLLWHGVEFTLHDGTKVVSPTIAPRV